MQSLALQSARRLLKPPPHQPGCCVRRSRPCASSPAPQPTYAWRSQRVRRTTGTERQTRRHRQTPALPTLCVCLAPRAANLRPGPAAVSTRGAPDACLRAPRTSLGLPSLRRLKHSQEHEVCNGSNLRRQAAWHAVTARNQETAARGFWHEPMNPPHSFISRSARWRLLKLRSRGGPGVCVIPGATGLSPSCPQAYGLK